MAEILNALMIGDVVGGAGMRALSRGLPAIRKTYRPDVVVVNAENVAEGYGLTHSHLADLESLGVAAVTTGNHVWQKREVFEQNSYAGTLLRPANYPEGVPGTGSITVSCGETKVGIINLQGRLRLTNIDCPFRKADEIIRAFGPAVRVILVDFHAEDTEEKEALGQYLARRVSVVAGTHTHIQTADERIIADATAYITDLGMTGPVDSVIGFVSAIALERMIGQMPHKMQVADSRAAVRGVAVEIDRATGKALSVERFERIPEL